MDKIKDIYPLLGAVCNQLEANQALIDEVNNLLEVHIPTEKKDTHEKERQKRWYTIQEYIKEYGFDIDIPFLPLVELEAIDTCRKLGYGFRDTENRYWHKFADTILEKVIDDEWEDDCEDYNGNEDCPYSRCPYYPDDDEDEDD